MKALQWASLLLATATATSALAAMPSITVSTNNTPQDRKVLDAVSREAFKRLGLGFVLVSLPSERSLQSADKGDVDGEGLRVAGLSDQYRNLVQVPERYISVSFVAFARKPVKLSVAQSWASLKPHRIAFITGWKMFEANAMEARVVTKVNGPEQLFRMLDSDRIDLALYTRRGGEDMIRKLGMSSIVALEPSLKDVDMHLYLHRKHELLVPRLAHALREMKNDGTHGRILASFGFD